MNCLGEKPLQGAHWGWRERPWGPGVTPGTHIPTSPRRARGGGHPQGGRAGRRWSGQGRGLWVRPGMAQAAGPAVPQGAPTAAWRSLGEAEGKLLARTCRAQTQRSKGKSCCLHPTGFGLLAQGGQSHTFQLSVVCSSMGIASKRKCFQLGAEDRRMLELNQCQAAAGLTGVNLTPWQCECFSCPALLGILQGLNAF